MQPIVPESVQWLVRDYAPTMEHIDVLLFLVRQDGVPQSLTAIIAGTGVRADLILAAIVDKNRATGTKRTG